MNIVYIAQILERKAFYIGKTEQGLEKRKVNHYQSCFKKLKQNIFYNFIRKYGWKSVDWKEIAEYETKKELSQAEKEWLLWHKEKYPDWQIMNITNGGDGGDTFTNNPRKEEIREKFKGRLSWSKGLKRLEISGENNPWFGKGYLQIGKNNPFYGKQHDEKSLQKMRTPHISQQGEKHHNAKSVILISPEGMEYKLSCYKPFCREHGLNVGHIYQVLQGRRKHHKGWTGKYFKEPLQNVSCKS
jgi:hypothetical protein